jgi:DNA-binding NtrC family response regulator
VPPPKTCASSQRRDGYERREPEQTLLHQVIARDWPSNPSTLRTRLQRAEAKLRKQIIELADSPAALESTMGSLEGWAREQLEPPE